MLNDACVRTESEICFPGCPSLSTGVGEMVGTAHPTALNSMSWPSRSAGLKVVLSTGSFSALQLLVISPLYEFSSRGKRFIDGVREDARDTNPRFWLAMRQPVGHCCGHVLAAE